MSQLIEDNNKTFNKRSGTSSQGKEYENLLTALVALRLAKNDKVQNFCLSSNDNNFENFDDVVLKTSYKNGTTANYAVQVKHRENQKRTITKDSLAAEEGNFSIHEYFKGFRKLSEKKSVKVDDVNFILYTSATFEMSQYGFKFYLKNKKHINVKAHQFPLPDDDIFNTSGNNYVYKFEIITSNCNTTENRSEIEELDRFLKKFFLYANQKNFDDIKSSALKSFQKTYCCNQSSFKTYSDFITTWSELQGSKDYLDKKVINLIIGEILLKPYSVGIFLNSNINSKFLLFQEVIHEFDIIFAKTDARWSEMFDKSLSKNDIEEALKIGKKFCIISKEISNLDEIEDEQLTRILWYMNKIPLIIPLSEETQKIIYQAIEMCQENAPMKKFLLIAEEIKKSAFKSVKIFRTLSDLAPDSSIYKKIVRNHTISLQGRDPISLEKFIDGNEEIKEAITTDELIKIMDGSFRIGEEKESLPDPYIDQFLSKILIDFNIINNQNFSELMVISCNNQFKLLQSITYGVTTLIYVDQFLKEDQKHSQSQRFIIIAEHKCTTQEFETICENFFDKTCHHFCINSENNLEWITTKGKIDQLKQYQLPQQFKQESEVLKSVDNKINIICALPGMGKSVMMKYLKNTYSSNYWILKISFKEIFATIQHSRNVLQEILDFQKKKYKYTPFETKIIEMFVKQKRIVFLWDGLDELPKTSIQEAIEVVENLSHSGVTSWVTARDYFGQSDVFPITIKQLEKEQQNSYIKRYLKGSNHSEEEIGKIIKKITDLANIPQHLEVLGIPLQIQILSELFSRNTDKYFKLMNNTFTLADMIHHFIKEKFNVYFKDKCGCDVNNILMKKTIKNHWNFQILQYETIALKMYLPKEIVDTLQIKMLIPLTEDEFGIITQVDCNNNTATFLHSIYGKYFVATWLVKNVATVPNLNKFIFEEEYRNIRMIFDMKAAKNCPAHLAVLYTNFDTLQTTSLDQKDKVGRNPLHLASSLGQKHPLVSVEERQGKHVLDFLKGGMVKEDSDDYKKMIYFLVEKFDPLETDELFHWNSINYADHTFSLFPIEVFLKQHNILGTLEKLNDVASLVFYSVKFNYPNLFQSIDKIPYIEDNRYHLNLLHHVVKYQRATFLPKIFKNKKYFKAINQECFLAKPLLYFESPFFTKGKLGIFSIVRGTPLHFASCFGNAQAVKILIKQKADVNIANRGRETPLHWAAREGYL